MKQYFLKIAGLAALVLLLQPPAHAQEKDKPGEKKEIMDGQDELIIRRKSDKDGKIVLEIKNGEVFINGKPVNDFDDSTISVRVRGINSDLEFGVSGFNAPHSPFRTGNWSYNSDEFPGVDSKRAFLGVSSEKAENGGAVVTQVTKGSAAEKIGLKKGDVISKIDEMSIDNPEDLVKAIHQYKPETKVVVTYKRDGKEQKTTATLGKMQMDYESYNGVVWPKGEDMAPMMAPMPPMGAFSYKSPTGPRAYIWYSKGPRIGIKAQDTDDDKGAKVLDVDEDSPAAKAGIKEGDIITQFDGKNITNANELAETARSGKTKSSFKIKINRGGKAQDVEVKTPKKLKTADL
jgi:serine protease Do